MANLSVAILGLGRVGASVGLSLRRYMRDSGKHTFEITGYDRRQTAEKAALKLKAVDKTESRATQAVRGKDIVVLALPYDEVKAAYENLAHDLRDGVVILDTSPLTKPSLEWAGQHLTEEHHVVSITPTVNTKYLFDALDETERAAEDLFDGATLFLMPGVKCIKEAVDLAFQFTALLGAKPHFFDPHEHDALAAYMLLMPTVLGVASFYAALKNEGWNDLQRITNSEFGALTHDLFDTHPDDLRELWMADSETLARHLDSVIKVLQSVRGLLATGDKNAVEAMLVESAEAYEKWFNRRNKADWGDVPEADLPQGNIMSNMFGLGSLQKLFKNDNKEKK